jgi:SPW repeat
MLIHHVRATDNARRKDKRIMATPFRRRPEPGGDPTPAASAGSAAAQYPMPASAPGIAAQAAAAFSILIGLWVAISPLFIMLQHGGANANIADLIAGLVVAGIGALALASPRGFSGLQFVSLVLGVWVLISSFILDAKFSIATPMFWSNTLSGALLAVVALAGLGALRPATR